MRRGGLPLDLPGVRGDENRVVIRAKRFGTTTAFKAAEYMAEYYFKSGQENQSGPFNLPEMQGLVTAGKVSRICMVRNGQGAEWKLAMHFPELDFTAPSPSPKKSFALKNLAVISGLTFCIFGITFCAFMQNDHTAINSQPDKLRKTAFYTVTQDVISKRLKSPASAKFSSFDESIVNEIPGGYEVHGWVDSQNGFGSLIRSDFDCKLMVNGQQWSAESVKIGKR